MLLIQNSLSSSGVAHLQMQIPQNYAETSGLVDQTTAQINFPQAEYPTECSGPPHLLGPWGQSVGKQSNGLLVPCLVCRPAPFLSQSYYDLKFPDWRIFHRRFEFSDGAAGTGF